MSDDRPSIAELFAQARAAFDALTTDQKIHHRHEQRISFVVGNVGLSQPDRSRDKIEASIRGIVGPCPCAECRVDPDGPYR